MSYLTVVHLLHLFIIGSLLLFIGIKRNSMPSFMYTILLFLGPFIILYHLYKAYTVPKFAWANYIHIFLVGPLLTYIGYTKEKTERKYFELVLMLAFASVGYHGYYLVKGDN